MIARNRLRIALAVCLFGCGSSLAQGPEDAAWNQVVAEQREGFRLRAEELKASGDVRARLAQERAAAFRRAGARMNAFMKDFVADPAGVRYLKSLFQLGYYSELAAWDERALAIYDVCQAHPKLRDPEAVFGDPPQPLSTYLPLRIEAVTKRLNAGANQPTSVHSQLAFAKYSGKGGIDLNGIEAPPALPPEQSLQIARRLAFPEDLDRARVEWRRVLNAPQLQPLVEDASVPGMLVFAAKGSEEGARKTALLLDSYRRQLSERYFDSGLPGPLMIVLANLARPAVRTSVTYSNAAALPPMNAAALPPMNAAARPVREPASDPAAHIHLQAPVQQRPLEQRYSPMEQRAARDPAASDRESDGDAGELPAQTQSPVQQRPLEQRHYPMEQRAAPGVSPEPRRDSPEEIGRALSSAAHFRDMQDMEGYFESLDHSLVLRKNLVGEDGRMFLGTGLHELVHALIQVDYPLAPMWLNEGMAAMHEEFDGDGPRDNYRLYVARAAMESGRWPALKDLLDPNPAWWSSNVRPVMMAASRYFCMFLAQSGQLAAVYREMRREQVLDGAAAAAVLSRVTGQPIEQLEALWRDDILGRNIDALDARWRELQQPIRRYMQKVQPLVPIL